MSSNVGFADMILNELQDPVSLLLIAVSLYLIYQLIKPVPPPPAPRKKLEYRKYTPEDLKAFDGTNPQGTVLIGVKHKIYDCTPGKDFYGPGGPYANFAGRDATRALAKMSTKVEDIGPDRLPKWDDLPKGELDVLKDWVEKFDFKYDHVGDLVEKY
eukprot:Clim_evm28s201 gene=Clim_evmTU28s201